MSNKTHLKLRDFNLITVATQSILRSTAIPSYFPDLERSCTMFAFCGALTLTQTYRIPAKVFAGNFFVRQPGSDIVLSYAEGETVEGDSARQGFHAWVQTDTHIIDFMSPLYPNIVERHPQASHTEKLERRMLQIRLDDQAQSWEEFEAGMPILTDPTLYRTTDVVSIFSENTSLQSMANLTSQWVKLLRKNPKAVMDIGSDRGDHIRLKPLGLTASKSWPLTKP